MLIFIAEEKKKKKEKITVTKKPPKFTPNLRITPNFINNHFILYMNLLKTTVYREGLFSPTR